MKATNQEFSEGVRRYVLGILVVVYTFNFIDRQILSILIEPIKAELGLTDTAIGLLTGVAFALFYATMGIPIARIADRSNRRNLIAMALVVWSGMTALSGTAQNFWQLLAYRIGVGVGEAGCSPPAHSIIADYYPANRRATALGIYALGIPFGIMFGMFAGGWINEFFGWRTAFFVVGIPGLLLALVVRFTLKEPQRGMAEGRVEITSPPSIPETLKSLWRSRAFRHLAFGSALTAFVGYGWITWVPAFLIRSHGLGTGEAGTWLGLILGIPGGVGIVLGGFLSDRLGAQDTRWYLWIVALALTLGIPFAFGVFLWPTVNGALLFLVIPIVLANFYQAAAFSQTQGLVNLRMRSVAAAILLFVINIIGLGLGPSTIGALSDILQPEFGVESLRYSLLCVSMLNLWAAAHFFLGGRHLEADLAAVDPQLAQAG